MSALRRVVLMLLLVLVTAGVVWLQQRLNPPLPAGFINGNGRIEATQIDVATRWGGQISEVLVQEGQRVSAGQVLARMDIAHLEAQIRQAEANVQQARDAELSAQALVAQRQTELEYARRELSRSQELLLKRFITQAKVDSDQTQAHVAEAALQAAKAQAVAAKSSIAAAQAAVEQLNTQRDDSELKAARDGRIQYQLAQPGEVLAAGGKVLTLLDLSDVTLSLYLPETVAGQVQIGAQARIVLDALPDKPIPAEVSFVAAEAQFTPKQVETRSERDKLMFQVKVRIPKPLLLKHIDQVKTGLPGVAWVQLDPQQPWPSNLVTPYGTDH